MSTRYSTVAAGVLLALAGLASPRESQGQTNLPSPALRCEGAPIRLGPLRPNSMAELKGRPLCVYNFTSW